MRRISQLFQSFAAVSFRPRSRDRRGAYAWAALLTPALVVALSASVALAAALVQVQVRNAAGSPVDGTVTLTARTGDAPATFSCQTEAGACAIDNVPGGQYVATFAPNSGDAPAPRNVMIPPAGTVRLRVSAP